jgi:multiple sugar transport system substrate-binding protein
MQHIQVTHGTDENIKALTELYGTKGIKFDSSLVGGDEIALFYNETLKVAFCWNIAQQLNPNSANTGEARPSMVRKLPS